MEGEKCCGCKCSHHKIIPWCIVLIGATFLLGKMGIFTSGAVEIIWPILLIVAGVVKMKNCKCC